MQDLRKLEIFELSALLVIVNKEFIQAMKNKHPHYELLEMYQYIKEIQQQIEIHRTATKK